MLTFHTRGLAQTLKLTRLTVAQKFAPVVLHHSASGARRPTLPWGSGGDYGVVHSAVPGVIKLDHGGVHLRKRKASDSEFVIVRFFKLIETALRKQSGGGTWRCNRGGKLIGPLLYVHTHINVSAALFSWCQRLSWTSEQMVNMPSSEHRFTQKDKNIYIYIFFNQTNLVCRLLSVW